MEQKEEEEPPVLNYPQLMATLIEYHVRENGGAPLSQPAQRVLLDWARNQRAREGVQEEEAVLAAWIEDMRKKALADSHPPQ